MIVSLGEKEDTLTNPSELWPNTRKEVNFGTLTLTEKDFEKIMSVLILIIIP